MPDLDEQQTRHLPWPDEWPAPGGTKHVATAVVFAVLGLGSVAGAVMALSATPPDGRGLIMAICAPLFLGFASIAVLTRLRVRDRGTASVHLERIEMAGSQAVVVPYSRRLALTYVAMTAAMLALFGLITVVAILVVTGNDPRGTGMSVLLVASALAALYLLWLVLEAARGRLRRGTLALAPSGIYHRSWAFTSFFAWDSVISVSAGTTGGQLITTAVYDNSNPHFHRRSRLWKQPELSLAPHMGVQGTNLSIDPALAIQTLRYYHEHPEARPELATQAGVDRIRRARVLDEEL